MRAREGFVAAFGSTPQGVWSAPGRVNLIGEHTDYNDGLALPIALPQRTYAAVSRRDDRLVRAVSADLPPEQNSVEIDLGDVAAGVPSGWGAYVAGVIWALERAGHPVGGVDIFVASTVPVGAGLSSSAALECSVAAAASDLFGLDLLDSDPGRAALAAAGDRAENDIALAPTGGMDQAISMRAREGHALMLDCRDGHVEHVPFDLAAHGLALLVVDTKAEHALVDGQYAQRRRSCEQAARELRVPALRDVVPERLADALAKLTTDVVRARTRHVVTEIDRVRQCVAALRRSDLDEVGRLFSASHASLRDDFEVSCDELDLTVEVATSLGALGARMTGGGFGGSAIAIVPAPEAEAIGAAVIAAFADRGWHEPAPFVAYAAAGAARHTD